MVCYTGIDFYNHFDYFDDRIDRAQLALGERFYSSSEEIIDRIYSVIHNGIDKKYFCEYKKNLIISYYEKTINESFD